MSHQWHVLVQENKTFLLMFCFELFGYSYSQFEHCLLTSCYCLRDRYDFILFSAVVVGFLLGLD